jgi:hypothetical protein
VLLYHFFIPCQVPARLFLKNALFYLKVVKTAFKLIYAGVYCIIPIVAAPIMLNNGCSTKWRSTQKGLGMLKCSEVNL